MLDLLKLIQKKQELKLSLAGQEFTDDFAYSFGCGDTCSGSCTGSCESSCSGRCTGPGCSGLW